MQSAQRKRCTRCAGFGEVRESQREHPSLAAQTNTHGGFGLHSFNPQPARRPCPDCGGKGTVDA